MIISRFAYWLKDAKEQLGPDAPRPITSREDYRRIPLPNKPLNTQYNKKREAFKKYLVPQSPVEAAKIKAKISQSATVPSQDLQDYNT